MTIADEGTILEALNDKMDRDMENRTTTFHYVTETSNKNLLPTWYRVYDDGWCEQGGIVTTSTTGWNNISVSFLKAFKDTNYTIVNSQNTGDTTRNTYQHFQFHNKAAASIIVDAYFWDTSESQNWQACGYIN